MSSGYKLTISCLAGLNQSSVVWGSEVEGPTLALWNFPPWFLERPCQSDAGNSGWARVQNAALFSIMIRQKPLFRLKAHRHPCPLPLLAFWRVNLASVGIHYHLLSVRCQRTSYRGLVLFFCGPIIVLLDQTGADKNKKKSQSKKRMNWHTLPYECNVNGGSVRFEQNKSHSDFLGCHMWMFFKLNTSACRCPSPNLAFPSPAICKQSKVRRLFPFLHSLAFCLYFFVFFRAK